MAGQKTGSDSRRLRVPESCGGIQVNHCKNPVCENFWAPALNKRTDLRYTRVGANKPPVALPLDSKGEVEKTFSHQTAREGQDVDRLARILLRCSLLPTERFMLRVRRRLSMLERGIPTAAGDRRSWIGRAPYNPMFSQESHAALLALLF